MLHVLVTCGLLIGCVYCSFTLIVTELREQYTLLILAEEEFVAVDLTSAGWPLHRLPYLDSIHASTILSATHVSDVPASLWSQISCVGNQQYASCSSEVS
jgi:hypothetical protein